MPFLVSEAQQIVPKIWEVPDNPWPRYLPTKGVRLPWSALCHLTDLTALATIEDLLILTYICLKYLFVVTQMNFVCMHIAWGRPCQEVV